MFTNSLPLPISPAALLCFAAAAAAAAVPGLRVTVMGWPKGGEQRRAGVASHLEVNCISRPIRLPRSSKQKTLGLLPCPAQIHREFETACASYNYRFMPVLV